MLTTAAINTQAGSPPTVTLSGVEVQSGGFSVTAAVAETDPDANYQTKTATATKFLTGSEPQESS